MSAPHSTGRWQGVIALSLAAAGVAILASRPDLFLVAAVGVVFAVYPRVTATSRPQLAIERELTPATPTPDEAVEVRVTVTNEGTRTLADVRVVDGVPPLLGVADGSPRCGMVLRPAASRTFSYTLDVPRGRYAFDPVTVISRDVSGAIETIERIPVETTIDCASDVADPPLRAWTATGGGQLEADRGGSGIEFHRTREYRPGDPFHRIDWHRLARTGELASIEYDEPQAISVVLAVDARPPAYRSVAGRPPAVADCASAAYRLANELHARRNWIGVAVLGRPDRWLPPGSGEAHLQTAAQLLTMDAELSDPDRSADESPGNTLRERLSETTQTIVCSPLCDDTIVEMCRTLHAEGTPVTVITPDVTDGSSPGKRLARLERSSRLSRLRSDRITVVDWDPRDPLATALAPPGGGTG